MALYDFVFSVLYSGRDIRITASDARHAHAPEDSMLCSHADLVYKEAKRIIIVIIIRLDLNSQIIGIGYR